ncbi:MAG TPA: metallophosphoesterase [Vicinamibacterales bacterium]|nr:metallophosphoesterase [Vicinamibacterales bacterium]
MIEHRRTAGGLVHAGVVVAACAIAAAQQPAAPVIPAWVDVKPIAPPRTPLPPEAATAQVTRFSFVAYGDTRSGGPTATAPDDGQAPNAAHAVVMDAMLAKVKELSSTPAPVRFVLQSGDAVLRGVEGSRFNIGFTPIIERLTAGANVPYFFSVGNHDTTSASAPGDPLRAVGLHNTLTAMSKLIPAEGSPRRLNGYPTYAFGYGNMFVLAIDSNIPADPVQLSWVTSQLEHLDRGRFPHIAVFFHHPPFSSGPHSGASADPVPGTGRKAADRPEAQTLAIRNLYMPLFRRHHVRLLITGHEHQYDHFVERYDDQGVTHRMDVIVTGGGGAPITTYYGEQDLRAYLAAGAAANVKVEHLMKPGMTPAENPHHFVVIQVDGDKLLLEVVGTGPAPYAPYPGGVSKLSLSDVRRSS